MLSMTEKQWEIKTALLDKLDEVVGLGITSLAGWRRRPDNGACLDKNPW